MHWHWGRFLSIVVMFRAAISTLMELRIQEGDKWCLFSTCGSTSHKKGMPVVYTHWHPEAMFCRKRGIWPPTVFRIQGCRFPSGSIVHGEVCRKGFVSDKEAYSGFDGRVAGPDGPALDRWLKEQEVSRIYVGGLATDYCVKATALDGIRNGYEVVVLKDGVRAVDVRQGDGGRAIAEMVDAGAVLE